MSVARFLFTIKSQGVLNLSRICNLRLNALIKKNQFSTTSVALAGSPKDFPPVTRAEYISPEKYAIFLFFFTGIPFTIGYTFLYFVQENESFRALMYDWFPNVHWPIYIDPRDKDLFEMEPRHPFGKPVREYPHFIKPVTHHSVHSDEHHDH